MCFAILKSLPKNASSSFCSRFYLHECFSRFICLHLQKGESVCIPRNIRFKPCDEMHLVFSLSHPTHPVCFGLRPVLQATASLPAPTWSILHARGILQLVVFAGLHWLLLFHQPVVWAAFCFQPQWPGKFHLAMPCIPCQTDVMHFSPSLRSAGPFCKLAAVASQSALSSH